MRKLAVYFNDVFAGVLAEQFPGRAYSFRYSDAYLKSELPPVSVTLPKLNQIFYSERLFPFFSNMLPEGANRRAICQSLHIDEYDFLGLLIAMADKDFIGAVNVRSFDDDYN